MNASGKPDDGFHKVTPDPEETPQDDDVRPGAAGDDTGTDDDGTDGDYEATGPARQAGAEET